MPRRGNVPKREVLPDPMYNSVLVTKLVNSVMLDGKKGVAQKVVYSAFDMIKDKTGNEPLDVFNQAMENIMPSLETKSRRVGGATYQVPMEVRPARRQTLGLRWLTAYARARGERTMAERLAGEIMDAANNSGSAVKKREDTHKMAESNKAFDHDYRAYSVLHRRQLQDRRDPRRYRHDGLDGSGTGAWYHHHLRCYHLLLEGQQEPVPADPLEHHRHPGPRRLHC